MNDFELPLTEFLRHVVQAGPRIMWLFGAGVSRSSGLPTASDISWDLKKRLYCAEQNQDVQSHDVGNKAVRARIQAYFESKGFPALGDAREYSHYFKTAFGGDYGAQQRYLEEALSRDKISSTVGHRALSALINLKRVQAIFSTNFDEVVEVSTAAITGQNLTAFHLEGSYAALDALNADRFPLYAKLHGDFKYRSVKNLAEDLLHNDEQIQKCFLAAAGRFGLVVAGYSGRDGNVMSMLRAAIEQNNAFPHGLFWAVPRIVEVTPVVQELIAYARSRGIKAAVVETGTFDEMFLKIWRHTPDRPPDLDAKVRSAIARPVAIVLPARGNGFPWLRTNALLVSGFPTGCGSVEYDGHVEIGKIKSKLFELSPDCTLAYTDRILYWGSASEVEKVLEPQRIRATTGFVFEDLARSVDELGFVKAMVEETICRAMLRDKPLLLRKDGRTWYAVVKNSEGGQDRFLALRKALGFKGSPVPLTGEVRGQAGVYWAEAVAIRLEERNGSLWLLLRPDVWISPLKEREGAVDFLRNRKLKRYNAQAFEVLSSWIELLLGTVGDAQPANVVAFPDSDNSATFQISTRTAFSRSSTGNA